MTKIDADIVIVGAGFAGALLTLGCRQIGLRPVLIEAGTHPRFALGESSTPMADLILGDLAKEFGLDWLTPLCHYGTWIERYPQLRRGLKRGFSYFHHRKGERFTTDGAHASEMLVAASESDALADTHWLRADVDTFLVDHVCNANIPYFDQTTVHSATNDTCWRMEADGAHGRLEIRAPFVIDATGSEQFLVRFLAIPSSASTLATNSWGIYGHFAKLPLWETELRKLGIPMDDHPFACDRSAVHHLMDGRWMWMLRFDHDIVSAGILSDGRLHPASRTNSVSLHWRQILGEYPSLKDLFANAEVVAPAQGLVRTGRLQRRVARSAGPNWAMLPATAYTLDALHSTGIAHSLVAVERLLHGIQRHWGQTGWASALVDYDHRLQNEITVVDRLVAGGYHCLGDFEKFTTYARWYFAGATLAESRRRSADGEKSEIGFLNADRSDFVCDLAAVYGELLTPAENHRQRWIESANRRLAPYDRIGLNNPEVPNMYPRT